MLNPKDFLPVSEAPTTRSPSDRLWTVIMRTAVILILGLLGFSYQVNGRLEAVEGGERSGAVLTTEDRAELEKQIDRVLRELSEKLLPILLEIRDLRAAGYRVRDLEERIAKLEESLR